MRRMVCVALIVLVAGSAYAELQNVQVGGQIRIRGRYWRNGWNGPRETRIPNSFLPGRPIGFLGASSVYDWDDDGHNRTIVEQRTSLYVSADFTEDVCAFIELQDYAVWGEDFRSNYVTGADSRANSADDVEVQQAYIQVEQLLGQPLRLRIGRQDLKFGKGWLIGNQISPTLGLSYDAIRLTYDCDVLSVDAVWAKLAERSPAEEDGDV
ncbi:MAG: alginate export family protein, partial [bacterium]|nr:alginate export family protein [bacterium]